MTPAVAVRGSGRGFRGVLLLIAAAAAISCAPVGHPPTDALRSGIPTRPAPIEEAAAIAAAASLPDTVVVPPDAHYTVWRDSDPLVLRLGRLFQILPEALEFCTDPPGFAGTLVYDSTANAMCLEDAPDTTKFIRAGFDLARELVVDLPDSGCSPCVPFSEWPTDSQSVFLRDNWRQLFGVAGQAPIDTGSPPDSGSAHFIADDFRYLGAFRVPHYLGGGEATQTAWGGLRTLDISGGLLWTNTHESYGLVGAITIPEPSLSRNVAELPVAAVAVPAYDATAGHFTGIGGQIPRSGDLIVDPPDTLALAWDAYNAASQDRLGLSINRSRQHLGPTRDGDPTNPTHYLKWTSGLCRADATWAARYAPGIEYVATGGEREAGGTYGSPSGPAAFGFSPGSGAELPVVTLLTYTPQHPAPDFSRCSDPTNEICSADTFTDAAWLRVGDRSSLAFFASKCDSTSHYFDDPDEPNPEYNDDPGFCDENKGQVCDGPYRFEVWLYDDDELGEVALGERESWDVDPYLRHDLTAHLFPQCQIGLAGVAFHRETRRLYVGQFSVDGDYPVVHVFELAQR